MDNFLMNPAAPWILIVGSVVSGAALWFAAGLGRGLVRRTAQVAAGVLWVIGISMMIGAGSVSMKARSFAKSYPMPGQSVALDGTTAHLWCEGPTVPGTAPIIWLSGSYGQGLWMKPLHDRVKDDRRSCLIDRPGVGWAGPASLPRSVDVVVAEIRETLMRAGEEGPFVFIGHSFGGLYSANFADAYPNEVEAVVLLDPTPPAWFVEQQGRWGCGTGSPSLVKVLGAMFGLGNLAAFNPLLQPGAEALKAAIGEEDWAPLVFFETRVSSIMANSSAMHAACAEPFSIVRAPGALADLPLLTIVQTRDDNWRDFAPEGLSAREMKNWELWAEVKTNQYTTLSSRAELVFAPQGGSHYFPILLPDFTIAETTRFLAGLEAELDKGLEADLGESMAAQDDIPEDDPDPELLPEGEAP